MSFSIVHKNSCIIIIIIKILVPSVVLYIVSYNPVTVGALNNKGLSFKLYGKLIFSTCFESVSLH